MAKTGESYTAARRQVITEFQAAGGNEPAGEPKRFAISYDDMGPISTWADTQLGGGPAGGRIEVDASELRLVLTGHALAAAWTWRDIRQQRPSRSGGVKPSGGSPAQSTLSARSATG